MFKVKLKCSCGNKFWSSLMNTDEEFNRVVCPKCRLDHYGNFSCEGCKYIYKKINSTEFACGHPDFPFDEFPSKLKCPLRKDLK